jgi:serine/threonine protein kinase
MDVYDSLNPQNQIGTQVSKYTIQSILGEGSFSVVFLGVDSQNEKKAIKCLYKQGLSHQQLLLQREEVEMLRELNGHPHIIQLLETVETKDHYYMVLEFCEIDLFDYIMKNKLSEQKALKLFEQLCMAIQYCHDRGIYHRDLKPENILLTASRNPSIKVTDFGLSTRNQLSTEYGCGSVRYMSPECMKPEKGAKTPYLSAANDVWSLGIILINLLTSKNPWVEPAQKDKHFKTHLLSKYHKSGQDSFQHQFGFNESLCVVLRRVFDLNPQHRPSPMQLYWMVKQALEGTISLVPSKPVVKHGLLTPSSLQSSLQSLHMEDVMDVDDVVEFDTAPQEALDWFLL